MGQYYQPLLIDDSGGMLTACSHDFNNGPKLMEHSWVGNNFVNAILKKLDNNPMRVAWLGDYSSDLCNEAYINMGGGFVADKEDFADYYGSVWLEECQPHAPLMKNDNSEYLLDIEHADCFLVNVTKGCYIDMQEYVKENETNETFDNSGFSPWCINPLPLLTSVGNGQGGGDYRSKIGMDDVGSWAFDKVYITALRPVRLGKVMYHFREV